ncbi:hypothetical protein ACOSP7_012398 [Xanthoceras sorbifolium]
MIIELNASKEYLKLITGTLNTVNNQYIIESICFIINNQNKYGSYEVHVESTSAGDLFSPAPPKTI